MTDQNLLDLFPRVSTAVVQVRWLACDVITAVALKDLALLLDDEERARAERFHFERDRHAYVAAHALARVMLSAQRPAPPSDWKFASNEYGRPEVVRKEGAPPLRFNLSHTRGLVAVALTLANEVGIDVEAVDPHRLGLDLAKRTFAEAEVAALGDAPEAELTEKLFALWTCKEACVKALGRGLAVPLDAFQVCLDPLGVSFSEALGENPAHWLLERFAPTQNHVLAVALRHSNPDVVSIDAAGLETSQLLNAAASFGVVREE